METVAWFIKSDLLKRPLRSVLIVAMGTIAVIVLAVMMSISNVGFQILESYVKLLNPNVVVVLGPSLPISPQEVSHIPHVKKVLPLVVTDAYLKCGKNYTYIMLIGFYNFTSITKVTKVQLVKGSPDGLMVPTSLSNLLGRNCSVIIPFLGPYNVTVTGIIKAPTLQSVLGKSKVAMISFLKLPGVEPNALVLIVDKTSNVGYVVKRINELTGGQAYVLSQRSLAKIEELIRMSSNLVSLFIGILALSIVSIALAVTMIMDVRGRAWEIGLLKALGYTSKQLAMVYLSETLAYALSSLALGLLLSIQIIDFAKRVFVEEFSKKGFDISGIIKSMNLTPEQIAFASVITVSMMLISAALPALSVYKLEPVEALRTIE